MTRILRPAILATIAAAVAFVPEAQAQDPTPPPPPPGPAELVFEREVFTYPSFTRRNPFRPLDGADSGGPRFERLSLIGIMYSPDPGAGVAVLSTGGVTVGEDGTMTAVEGEAFNAKVGDRIGNTTIVEIRRDAVIVDVEVFDSVERHTMTFVSRIGGTP